MAALAGTPASRTGTALLCAALLGACELCNSCPVLLWWLGPQSTSQLALPLLSVTSARPLSMSRVAPLLRATES